MSDWPESCPECGSPDIMLTQQGHTQTYEGYCDACKHEWTVEL